MKFTGSILTALIIAAVLIMTAPIAAAPASGLASQLTVWVCTFIPPATVSCYPVNVPGGTGPGVIPGNPGGGGNSGSRRGGRK